MLSPQYCPLHTARGKRVNPLCGLLQFIPTPLRQLQFRHAEPTGKKVVLNVYAPWPAYGHG